MGYEVLDNLALNYHSVLSSTTLSLIPSNSSYTTALLALQRANQALTSRLFHGLFSFAWNAPPPDSFMAHPLTLLKSLLTSHYPN